MNYKYNISVIVATYNSDFNKLISTLFSIVIQKNINFEIIITDDGSENDYFANILNYFERNNFSNFKLFKNKINVGTVNNGYNAILMADGEYIFGISPGDMLYDENTLAKLYSFAVNKKAEVCFGDAVYYSRINEQVKVLNEINNAPLRGDVFDEKTSMKAQKIGFFYGNYILGVAFLRKRSIAIKYIGEIKDICKYVEDNTSTAFILADNIRIYHFKDNIVWYEYGSGISTSNNKKWEYLMNLDYDASFEKLYRNYSQDTVINAIYHTHKLKNKILKALYLLLKYPNILFTILKIKRLPKSIGIIHKYNIDILKRYIKIGDDY